MIYLNESDVLETYKNNQSLRVTAKEFQTSVQPILRILNKYNITKNSSRKYTCNFDFFEKIDNEEKAYWLGFLYADGYVRVRKSSSEMKLKIIDKEHLEKFNKSLESNYPITKVKETNCWQISISNRKIVQDLVDKGCFQKKSLVLKYPSENILSIELQRHFIRGYFDGDGCIYFQIDKPKKIVNFLGTLDFLEKIKSLLTDNEINGIIRKRTNCKIFELSYGKYDDILKIQKLFYENSYYYLERKKKKFDIFYQIYLNRRSLYE